MPPPHPLRRISTGSLSSLARSQDRAYPSPSGLDFLQSALTELADEASTLASNVQHMTTLHDALGTFNEGFAAYLYALKMNAFCTEWPEAPDSNSWARLPSLLEPTPIQESTHVATLPEATTPRHGTAAADMTYASNSGEEFIKVTSERAKPNLVAGSHLPALAARKMLAAKKKKRAMEISAIIDSLPLEYRGNDATARLAMELVITKLMDHPLGLIMSGIVAPPELPQTKANRCLITLVAKKLVKKSSVEGKTKYLWIAQ